MWMTMQGLVTTAAIADLTAAVTLTRMTLIESE